MNSIAIPYASLSAELASSDRDIGKLRLYVERTYPTLEDSKIEFVLRAVQKRFLPHFSQRWNTVHRSQAKFKIRFRDWLDGVFRVEFQDNLPPHTSISAAGRPRKSFDECSDRAKRYKRDKVRAAFSQEEINSASTTETSTSSTTLDADKALALFVQAELTKQQYEILRQSLKNEGHNILPPYYRVLEAKTRCYPNNVIVEESSAGVSLQNLLDHTTTRLLNCKIADDVEQIQDECLILSTKWGCDGASGQSEYNQRFTQKDDNEDVSDANLFMTSIVPLKMTLQQDKNSIVWQNDRPSSTRYCRCLQFKFQKETQEVIRAEKSRVETEIANLKETVVTIGNRVFQVKHKLMFTMLDGKTAQAITETPAASSCFICGVTTSQMNKLTAIKNKPISKEATKFGMSPLHARIKFMECILHVAYNLPFERWRIDTNTRPIRDARKAFIRKEFREKLGIKVDVVKQGTGTTNDGNTSRRFFANPALTSEITGISEDLIRRFAVILEVITCNEIVDATKFGKYAWETAEMYVAKYMWYNMPSTVHKVLVHGQQIIENFIFPVGSLSEEAQECRNKDYKRYRCLHSRKCSRIATNEDVIHMMFLSSDPVITHLRPNPKKKIIPISDEAKELVI